MPTKEQELTFKTIDEFFALAEQIVTQVSESLDDISEEEIFQRLNIIEKFLETIINNAENLSADYSKFVQGDVNPSEDFQKRLEERIVVIINNLNKCREELLARI